MGVGPSVDRACERCSYLTGAVRLDHSVPCLPTIDMIVHLTIPGVPAARVDSKYVNGVLPPTNPLTPRHPPDAIIPSKPTWPL